MKRTRVLLKASLVLWIVGFSLILTSTPAVAAEQTNEAGGGEKKSSADIPKDHLSMTWVKFIEAHPPLTPQAHPELHADIDWIKDKDEFTGYVGDIRNKLTMGMGEDFNGQNITYNDIDKALGELLRCSVTADDYLLYAVTRQAQFNAIDNLVFAVLEDGQIESKEAAREMLMRARAGWLEEGIKAATLAIELGIKDKGLAFARIASMQAQQGRYDEAFATLDRAVAGGFNGFIWLRRAALFETLREQPRWSQWYASKLPGGVMETPLKKGWRGSVTVRSGEGETFYFCEDGRYFEEVIYRTEGRLVMGRWLVSDKGLELSPEKRCETGAGGYDINELPCAVVKAEGQAAQKIFLSRQDLKIIQYASKNYRDEAIDYTIDPPSICAATSK